MLTRPFFLAAYRLYLEYGRMVHPDRDSGAMDFVVGGQRRPAPVPEKLKKEKGTAE